MFIEAVIEGTRSIPLKITSSMFVYLFVYLFIYLGFHRKYLPWQSYFSAHFLLHTGSEYVSVESIDEMEVVHILPDSSSVCNRQYTCIHDMRSVVISSKYSTL